MTGASAGLGRELVRQLVRDRGMIVLATARRLDRLEALADELPAGRVLIEPGDLADPEFRDRLWTRVESLPGGLDVLVNNAGLGQYTAFEDQGGEDIERIIEVNFLALADLTGRSIRHMKARGGGQIVEVSSVLGFIGMPYSAVYVASKHAVNGLVKSLRYELRGSGVKVWAACPGRTESEFSRVAIGAGDDPGALRGDLPRGESTARVVRGIVRGIDRGGGRFDGFVFPSLLAWTTVTLAQWLPRTFRVVHAALVAGTFSG